MQPRDSIHSAFVCLFFLRASLSHDLLSLFSLPVAILFAIIVEQRRRRKDGRFTIRFLQEMISVNALHKFIFVAGRVYWRRSMLLDVTYRQALSLKVSRRNRALYVIYNNQVHQLHLYQN